MKPDAPWKVTNEEILDARDHDETRFFRILEGMAKGLVLRYADFLTGDDREAVVADMATHAWQVRAKLAPGRNAHSYLTQTLLNSLRKALNKREQQRRNELAHLEHLKETHPDLFEALAS